MEIKHRSDWPVYTVLHLLKGLKGHYRIEEAKKRDHRKLGKELDLSILMRTPQVWYTHQKGTWLYQHLTEYVPLEDQERLSKVRTPEIVESLWEKSVLYG